MSAAKKSPEKEAFPLEARRGFGPAVATDDGRNEWDGWQSRTRVCDRGSSGDRVTTIDAENLCLMYEIRNSGVGVSRWCALVSIVQADKRPNSAEGNQVWCSKAMLMHRLWPPKRVHTQKLLGLVLIPCSS